MWKKIRLILDGFLIGLILEYSIRVDVSIFAIVIGTLILATVVLEFISDKRDKNRSVLPKGWAIHDFGQDTVNEWYITLVNIDEIDDESVRMPALIHVKGKSSYYKALTTAISEI